MEFHARLPIRQPLKTIMIRVLQFVAPPRHRSRVAAIVTVLSMAAAGVPVVAQQVGVPQAKLETVLARTSAQVSSFLDQFSEVKCTESVSQVKLGENGKIEAKEESTFDYLAIFTNAGGELILSESRLPLKQ